MQTPYVHSCLSALRLKQKKALRAGAWQFKLHWLHLLCAQSETQLLSIHPSARSSAQHVCMLDGEGGVRPRADGEARRGEALQACGLRAPGAGSFHGRATEAICAGFREQPAECKKLTERSRPPLPTSSICTSACERRATCAPYS